MAEGGGINTHVLETKIREQSKWLKNASNGSAEASTRCTKCWDYAHNHPAWDVRGCRQKAMDGKEYADQLVVDYTNLQEFIQQFQSGYHLPTLTQLLADNKEALELINTRCGLLQEGTKIFRRNTSRCVRDRCHEREASMKFASAFRKYQNGVGSLEDVELYYSAFIALVKTFSPDGSATLSAAEKEEERRFVQKVADHGGWDDVFGNPLTTGSGESEFGIPPNMAAPYDPLRAETPAWDGLNELFKTPATSRPDSPNHIVYRPDANGTYRSTQEIHLTNTKWSGEETKDEAIILDKTPKDTPRDTPKDTPKDNKQAAKVIEDLFNNQKGLTTQLAPDRWTQGMAADISPFPDLMSFEPLDSSQFPPLNKTTHYSYSKTTRVLKTAGGGGGEGGISGGGGGGGDGGI